MPAINFQERFADLVEDHEKRQTIRPERKRPIVLSDILYLYTGMRTKRCRKLRTAVCLGTRTITITMDAVIFEECYWWGLGRFVGALANADGFDSWSEMRDWFDKRYGLPFEGVLITW